MTRFTWLGALMLAGFQDQAREVSVRTMRIAEDFGKPSNIAICAVNVAAMHQLSFNPRRSSRSHTTRPISAAPTGLHN